MFNVGSGTEVSMRASSVTGREVEEISGVTDDSYGLVADISKVTALGYKPRVPLAEGVKSLGVELGDASDLATAPTIFKRRQKAEK